MSRFFAGSDSSDESGEDRSDVSDSGDEGAKKAPLPTKFAKAGVDSDSDDFSDGEHKRVVRSQKDKRYDEMTATIKKIKSALSTNDWNTVHTEFEKLNKQYLKAQGVLATDGAPRFYVKILVELEDALQVALANKEAQKKMSSTNAKSLNVMKQKLKKHNKTFEKDIDNYRKNPDKEVAEAGGEVSSESDEEKPKAEAAPVPAKKAPAKPAPKPTKEEYSDDSDFPDDDDDDDDDEDVSDTGGDSGPEFVAETSRKSKWLKSATQKKEEPAAKAKQPHKAGKPTEAAAEEPEILIAAKEDKEKDKELTPEQIDQKIKEIIESRGRKKTNKTEQIATLQSLFDKSKAVEQQLRIVVQIVITYFDLAPQKMSVDNWKKAHKELSRILDILTSNSLVLEEEEEGAPTIVGPDEEEGVRVQGNLVAFFEHLDDEFIRSIIDPDRIDPHTHAYIQRLQDETQLLELADRVQAYYEKAGKLPSAARIAARRVEHMYYKMDHPAKRDVDEAAPASSAAAEDPKTEDPKTEDPKTEDPKTEAPKTEALKTETPSFQFPLAPAQHSEDLIAQLSNFVYKYATNERAKSRTVLCQIYHNAIHHKFYEARDVLLMTHLQENIHHMDISTQILYNRALVQLGLCAFRNGLITEAHSCLMEICSSGKIRELLAQGVKTARRGEKTPEQEKQERKRQVPYHMHINLELIECVHLISAMLLELPNMALNPYDPKPKAINRSFRRFYDIFDRQVYRGPPENARETVIAAAKALAKGDWKKSENLLLNLTAWKFMQNSDQVKAMLRRKIQEEGLRVYLLSFGKFYEAISWNDLSEMFELPKNTVHSLVSRMIANEELRGAWHQPSGCLVMAKDGIQPSKFHYLALQLAEKVAAMTEANERLLEPGSKPAGKEDHRQQTRTGQRGDRDHQRGDYQHGGRDHQRGDRDHQRGDHQRGDRDHQRRDQHQHRHHNKQQHQDKRPQQTVSG